MSMPRQGMRNDFFESKCLQGATNPKHRKALKLNGRISREACAPFTKT
jgi:hypothetical protein